MVAASLLAAAGCTASPAGVGFAGSGAEVAGPVRVTAGPTAVQLALGRWVRIPAAPIRICDADSVWDGRDLLTVEPGSPPCTPAAALLDPRTHRWMRIAAPPKAAGPAPVIAWGGGRLLMVSWRTGATVAWSSATGRWRLLPSVPTADVVSASWTGREFVVITARKLRVNQGIAEAFGLHGDRWTRLPDLPQPRHGQVTEAATATIDGAVYALAGVGTWHLDPNDTYEAEYSELLRLTRSSWERVRLPSDVPQSQQTLLSVQGSLVALGSGCPSTLCTQEDGAAALLRPGARAHVIPLLPKAGVPYPRDVAAGGRAIVVVYFEGLGDGPRPHYGRASGMTAIYDVASGSWLKGPTAPRTAAGLGFITAVVWTPYGVISIGSDRQSDWLLRPRKRT